jgi:hypothetical protein
MLSLSIDGAKGAAAGAGGDAVVLLLLAFGCVALMQRLFHSAGLPPEVLPAVLGAGLAVLLVLVWEMNAPRSALQRIPITLNRRSLSLAS